MVLCYPDNRKAPPHEVLLTFLWGAKELFIVLGMHADAMSLRESGAAMWQVAGGLLLNVYDGYVARKRG